MFFSMPHRRAIRFNEALMIWTSGMLSKTLSDDDTFRYLSRVEQNLECTAHGALLLRDVKIVLTELSAKMNKHVIDCKTPLYEIQRNPDKVTI